MKLDRDTAQQALPSLFVSLIGLLLMSKSLYHNIENTATNTLHYLFILNSFLCFKNNIELNYADIMSSTVRRLAVSSKKLSAFSIIEYVFACGTKMFFSSIAVSLIIGLCSNYANIAAIAQMKEVQKNALLIAGSVCSSFFSGACGSICTFFCVVLCIFGSIKLEYNPDNIILPIIASSADYISTVSLIYFSGNFYSLLHSIYPDVIVLKGADNLAPSRKIFFANCALISILIVLVAVIHHTERERKLPRLFNVWSLLCAFAVTMLGGVVVNLVSSKNHLLATMIPLFNGLAGSVALIYTSQVTTYVNGSTIVETSEVALDSDDESGARKEFENPRSLSTLAGLICISSILSLISCVAISWIFQKAPKSYVLTFGALLVFEVFLLYHLVNFFVSSLKMFKMSVSCHVVPLLNASSDLLGSVVLAIASIFLSPISGR